MNLKRVKIIKNCDFVLEEKENCFWFGSMSVFATDPFSIF